MSRFVEQEAEEDDEVEESDDEGRKLKYGKHYDENKMYYNREELRPQHRLDVN